MELSPELSDASVFALRSAASRLPAGRPLSTGAVFAVLPEIDHQAEWDRLWLETGDPRSLRLAEEPDGDETASARWAGLPLTPALAAALTVLEEIRRRYDIPAATPGLLAVALVADPASGAARRLARGGLHHGALLDLIQSEILGSTLDGLPALLHDLRREREAPPTPPPPSPLPPRPPPESAGATARVRPRLRRAGWMALSALALLGIVFAIRTSPSFHSAPPSVDPPFARPALTGHMVTTADVRSVLGAEPIEIADRPPASKLFTSTSPVAADVRATALVAGWQREWSSADQARYVEVIVFDLTDPRYLTWFRGACEPARTVAVPAAVAAVKSGYLVEEKDRAAFCVVAEKGDLSVYTLVGMSGPKAAATVSSVAQRLTARQWALAAGYRPPPEAGRTTHFARDSINRWLILAAVFLPLSLALPLMLGDRATWRRWRRRLRWRAPRDPFVVAVDPAARLALSETTALALLKVAVYVWLLRLSETVLMGTYQTSALLLAAFCVISLGESRILHGRRGRYTPRPFRGTGRLLAVGGLIVTAAVVASAFFVADFSLSLASLGFNPAGPDYLASRLGFVGAVGSLFVLAFAVLPLMLVRRLAMRRIREEAQALPGRHILLLRSFVDDNRRLRARRMDRASVIDRLCLRRWERFEEVIAAALTTIGPVIAVGRPGERLPPALGARRQEFPHDGWLAGVRRLINDSALVCMVVGRTRSLVDEMREIKGLGALPRAIFLIPPCDRREQRRRLAVLAGELGIPWFRVQAALRGRDVLLVVQNADPDRALIFTSRTPDDVSYEAAVNAAALVLGRPIEASAAVRTMVAELGRRTAGVRPVVPAGSPRPPAVYVFPPGEAPDYKPLYRRWTVLPWMLSAGLSVLVALFSVVIGINLKEHPGVATGNATAISLAEDDVTGDLYAAFNGGEVARLDLDKPGLTVVATSATHLDNLIVHGQTAFGDTPIDGTVTALNLTTRKPLWTVTVSPGVRGLALAGDLVVTTVPARHEVVALSARDGHRVAKRTVAGTPWGVTVSGKQFVVPIVDRGQLAYFAAADLAPGRTVTTVAGPQQVLDQGAMLWVLAPTEDRLVRFRADATGGSQDELLLTDPAGLASANPVWLAVQGRERITLVSADGRLQRVALPYRTISSLCVTRSGHVLVGVEGQVAQLR